MRTTTRRRRCQQSLKRVARNDHWFAWPLQSVPEHCDVFGKVGNLNNSKIGGGIGADDTRCFVLHNAQLAVIAS